MTCGGRREAGVIGESSRSRDCGASGVSRASPARLKAELNRTFVFAWAWTSGNAPRASGDAPAASSERRGTIGRLKLLVEGGCRGRETAPLPRLEMHNRQM